MTLRQKSIKMELFVLMDPVFTSLCPSIAQRLASDAFRHDKGAVERLLVEVRGKAMELMPGVPLAPNEKQGLAAFVNAGPAGWVWSVGQKLCDSQVRAGNGWRCELYSNKHTSPWELEQVWCRKRSRDWSASGSGADSTSRLRTCRLTPPVQISRRPHSAG